VKVYLDQRQALHRPLTYLSRGRMREPQEVPERIERILAGLSELDCPVLDATDHGSAPLVRAHDPAYLRFLESAHRRWLAVPEDWGDEVMSNVYVRHPNPRKGILAEAAYHQADGSCPIGPHTWSAAYWSAQSALTAAAALLDGERTVYALCRPPGHHARRDAAGGFCYLNNAAIAALALRSRFSRVAVFDPDMHHGQGLQEIFWERDDVFYVSVHGDPTDFYPVCSGHEDERGAGAGLGFTLNLPMPHGAAESVFFDRVDEAVRAMERFDPDVLVVSLGFDVYHADPQSRVAVTTPGFHRLGETLAAMCRPVLVVQEGGYDLDSLAANTQAFFSGLNG
jgi:acetoin utilization deacetylase AcuC-like enzyme